MGNISKREIETIILKNNKNWFVLVIIIIFIGLSPSLFRMIQSYRADHFISWVIRTLKSNNKQAGRDCHWHFYNIWPDLKWDAPSLKKYASKEVLKDFGACISDLMQKSSKSIELLNLIKIGLDYTCDDIISSKDFGHLLCRAIKRTYGKLPVGEDDYIDPSCVSQFYFWDSWGGCFIFALDELSENPACWQDFSKEEYQIVNDAIFRLSEAKPIGYWLNWIPMLLDDWPGLIEKADDDVLKREIIFLKSIMDRSNQSKKEYALLDKSLCRKLIKRLELARK